MGGLKLVSRKLLPMIPALLTLALLAGNLARGEIGGIPVTALDFAVVLAAGWLLLAPRHPERSEGSNAGAGGARDLSTRLRLAQDDGGISRETTLGAVVLGGAMAFSLVWGWLTLHPGTDELLRGAAYLGRILLYGFVAIGLARRGLPEKYFRASVIGLVLLGVAQLAVFPTISPELSAATGWDPHIGRMFSTWLDPNFLGGFLALGATIFAAKFLAAKDQKSKIKESDDVSRLAFDIWNLAFAAAAALGVLATFSRAGLLALVVGIGLVSAIRAPRLVLLGIVGIALALGISPRLQERVVGAFTVDETASLRLDSWREGIEVWETSPVFGAGFNLLPVARERRGGDAATGTHAEAGIESSHLTVLATTGVVGAGLWLLLWLSLLRDLWRGRRTGLFAGTAGLLVHGLFMNSLLFPFIVIGLGIALASRGNPHEA